MELLVVLAIIAILTSLTLPNYQNFIKKAKFTEAVMAVTPIKLAIELAIQTGQANETSELSAGRFGIPDNYVNTARHSHRYQHIKSIETDRGQITVTMTDALERITYILKLTSMVAPLTWQVSGTCRQHAVC